MSPLCGARRVICSLLSSNNPSKQTPHCMDTKITVADTVSKFLKSISNNRLFIYLRSSE